MLCGNWNCWQWWQWSARICSNHNLFLTMEIDDWAIINQEHNWIEMVIRWDGNTETWPLPEGTYAVRRSEVDYSKIQPKPEEAQ